MEAKEAKGGRSEAAQRQTQASTATDPKPKQQPQCLALQPQCLAFVASAASPAA